MQVVYPNPSCDGAPAEVSVEKATFNGWPRVFLEYVECKPFLRAEVYWIAELVGCARNLHQSAASFVQKHATPASAKTNLDSKLKKRVGKAGPFIVGNYSARRSYHAVANLFIPVSILLLN